MLPGGTESGVAPVFIPNDVQPGTHYLGVILDVTNVVPERNEDNNHLMSTQRINIMGPSRPDLIPMAVNPQGVSLKAGRERQIDVTIRNQGDLSVSAWSVDLSLTTQDPNPPPSDGWFPTPPFGIYSTVSLGRFTETVSISPGSETTVALPVEIPLTYTPVLSFTPRPLEGYFYLRIKVDPQNLISEANESNNTFTRPNSVYIVQPPDLVPISVTGTTSADVGSQVTVTIRVCNYGDGYAGAGWGGWETGIYLQDNTTMVLVERFIENGEYEPNRCYSSTNTVSLPPNIAPGVYHWRVSVDEQDAVEEINPFNTAELNNTVNGSIIAILPVVDLTPMQVSGPADAIQGTTIPVDWSVTNQGTGDDLNSWIMQLVISPDNEITSSDYVLLSKSVPPVGHGSVVSWTEDVVVGTDPGTYYLGIVADASNTVPERDETNNVMASAVALDVLPQPDLTPTAVQGPNQRHAGTSMIVSTDVANQGGGAAPAGWTRQLYISSDATISGDDTLLGTFLEAASLAPNGTISSQDNVTIPDTTPTGDYYIGVILVTPFPDSNTSNNSLASSQVIRIR
jgi:subtilase family serine protease